MAAFLLAVAFNKIEYEYFGGHGYVYFFPDQFAADQPQQVQEALRIVFDSLTYSSTVSQLRILKSSDTPCLMTDLISCLGMTDKLVKPYIEAALDHKLANQTLEIAAKSNYIATGSLTVSFFALIVSALTFFFRRK